MQWAAEAEGFDLRDPDAETREYAITGLWGASVSITDGDWTLHQAPVDGNDPLYWYGITGETASQLGPYDAEAGRREADRPYPLNTPTWLSDLREDPTGSENVASDRPEKLAEMQEALRTTLRDLNAPEEQLDRLGLRGD